MGVALLAASVAACATPRPPTTIEMPEDVYRASRDATIARLIARECGRYRLDRARMREVRESFENRMKATGVTDAQFDYMVENPPRERIQGDLFAYIERRDIVLGEGASSCAAGDAEMRASSAIASFLEAS